MGRGDKKAREGEFDQSTLYAYMEISQWNPFVQLIYTIKKSGVSLSACDPQNYLKS
jgi:hypothetical protein